MISASLVSYAFIGLALSCCGCAYELLQPLLIVVKNSLSSTSFVLEYLVCQTECGFVTPRFRKY
jgi:hypothetical protein